MGAEQEPYFSRMFCAKTLWLQKGKLMAFGETERVLKQYVSPRPLVAAR